MNRAEHLAWAKERALAYVKVGDLHGAIASLASDLNKHPETKVDPVLIYAGILSAQTPDAVTHWIEGFN